MFKSNTNRSLLIIAVVALAGLILAYSNHFHNEFHFDDTHTITSNQYIRDIGNIPSFFTDLATFGTMANNRSYRPVVTTLNAIDYWLGGGQEDTFFFHLSIFLWYIVQAGFMFLLYRRIFGFSMTSGNAKYVALLGTIFYMFHTANAETINYIIMRSDSFSTLCILASLLLYQWKTGKKWHLYLITMFIGIGTKEITVMFIPLLFLYVLYFEEKASLFDLFRFGKWTAFLRSFKATLPALVTGVAFFMFTRIYFRPEEGLLITDHPHSPFYYFITQWYIIVHYLANFILPLDLSADPDFKIITTLLDQRVLFSLAILLILLGIAIRTSKNHKPISYGLLWFFLTLAPTSSIKPFGQITNDHRTFLPYIGLVMSLAYYLYILWIRYKDIILSHRVYRYGLPALYMLIVLLHGWGVYQRNEVWKTEESLWADVATKSPENARGLMNYGLTKMQKGDYAGTLELFEKAMHIMPYYSYLHINMGILKNAMGAPREAEGYFKTALKYDRSNVEAYYYYARWLMDQKRNDEARSLLITANNISPGHARTIALLSTFDAKDKQIEKITKSLESQPTAEMYLELSLRHYQNGDYQQCIEACLKALEINPKYAEAYNNICSSYILLRQPEKAIEACKKALEINPQYQLARNNLNWAETVKKEQ